ncbi:hypothetical protein DSM104443_02072 [Usitatibacter rugosus]|uniref:Cytochrome c domain-containing protein n=1 Tax=Usitatibacter rugosus TaxID=2732067 RepID=A0A6M4GVD2_9PROT|nr:hypothetical protein [Usitatibacter rugosus]QJR11002.1 hypothetical protein DSM104443_02072 [Usitatibacter rugosus]
MRAPLLLLPALLTAATMTFAAGPDAVEGKKLVAEKKCEICHNNVTMGDAKAVYLRKDRKVTTLSKLKSQVAACNTELNLGLFPEDEEHIAAYLNREYYKFPVK